MSAILSFERVKTKDGRPSKRQKVKRNRCGNAMTIGFDEAVARVRSLPGKPLDAACEENLRSLVEIRDNAIHFMNEDRELARRTHEAGCASLRNYVTAVADWFDESLGDYRFAILPLSFEAMGKADALRPGKRSQQAVKLATYLDEAAKKHDGTASLYSASLQVDISIVGNRVGGATPVRLTVDPNAPAVTLRESDISKQFPLSYDKLVRRVRTRVPGFLADRTFNDAMR